MKDILQVIFAALGWVGTLSSIAIILIRKGKVNWLMKTTAILAILGIFGYVIVSKMQ